jgi:quercetin dioxygenase-like cupin family protein
MRFEKGKVFNVSSMVDYADGGVVSKELIHSDSGSVTMFSFDAGQRLSEHSAPYDAVVQVVDGEMELSVDGTPHVVKSGELFVIPNGARHSVYAKRRFKMIITMVRG